MEDQKAAIRGMKFDDREFKKSSRTPAYPQTQYQCVMVAMRDGVVAVRDSKDPTKNTIVFTDTEWKAFVGGVKDGEFDCV